MANAKKGQTKRWQRAQKPSYWARIPADVRYDADLPSGAKLLYGEIDALSKKKGYCWASNMYFARLYSKSVDTISRWVAALVEKDHISSVVKAEDANRRYLSPIPKSTHELMASAASDQQGTIRKNADSTIGKNAGTPIRKNAEGTIRKNAELNKTRGNKTRGNRENDPLPPVISDEDKIKMLQSRAEQNGGKLKPEDACQFAFLNSKVESPILDYDFFDFFESEVLGRFDKITITPAILADWHDQLFEKYGSKVTTAAISEHRSIRKGWQPMFADVVAIAKRIGREEKKKAEGRIAAEKRAAMKTAETRRAAEIVKPPDKMSDDELKEKFRKHIDNGNKFMASRLKKEIVKRTADKKLKGLG